MKLNDIISFNDLIETFEDKYSDEIKDGCKRGNCGLIAADFYVFAKKYNFNVKKVRGLFKIDKPDVSKENFTDKELKKMKEGGYDQTKTKDRIAFAKKNNLTDDLKMIPHEWNEYNGKIIDFSGRTQFVKTKLSNNLNKNRYVKKKVID
jgi:uncharacterized membrane protein YcgQ (UPF0703/DUF1980 family)